MVCWETVFEYIVAEDAARDVHGHMIGVYQPVVVVDEDGVSDNQHDQLRGCLELVETGVCRARLRRWNQLVLEDDDAQVLLALFQIAWLIPFSHVNFTLNAQYTSIIAEYLVVIVADKLEANIFQVRSLIDAVNSCIASVYFPKSVVFECHDHFFFV